VNEEELQEIGQRVADELAQLTLHQRRNALKQLLHPLRRVSVVRRNQVKPELLVVEKQLSTRRNPPATLLTASVQFDDFILGKYVHRKSQKSQKIQKKTHTHIHINGCRHSKLLRLRQKIIFCKLMYTVQYC